MLRIRTFIVLAALVLFALPSLAYTVVFKDGTKVVARDKYKIVDGKAILTLASGTQVSYDPAQIDVAKTEEENKNNIGTAVLLEKGKRKAAPTAPPPKQDSLSDLIKQQRAGIRKQELSRRQPEIGTDIPRTASGAPDLLQVEPETFSNRELVNEIQQYFRSQGIGDVSVLRSADESWPLVRAFANSEAAVFRSIAVAASALLEMQARYGEALPGIDLLIMANNTSKAGQFSLNAEMARELVDRKVEISRFFVKYVDF